MPLAAAAPGFGQDDVDLTVGFDDLFTVVIVFTGVCLAVLVAFAVGALWVDEHGDPEHRQQGTDRPRSTAAPRPPRNQPGVPPAGAGVRRLASSAPAMPSARGHYTVPLPRSAVRRPASSAPATPSAGRHQTVPLPRSVASRAASSAPATPAARGFHTMPLPRNVIEALKAYTKHQSADRHAAGHL